MSGVRVRAPLCAKETTHYNLMRVRKGRKRARGGANDFTLATGYPNAA